MECFQAYSSGLLSGTFQWYVFGHRSVFEHISVEAFGCIFKWNALGCIPVEYFLACSCGMLSGIVELNAFGYWNGFGHIPVECFRSYYNEMLSRKVLGVFQWITFGRIPVNAFGHFQWNAFEHWKEECLRVYPREMLSGIFQWNAFGQRGVFEHISVESFWANSGEMLWGILLGLS